MKTQERRAFDQPCDAEIRAVLDRVVASRAFSKSQQLANFLRFVVETALTGNSSRIKAYTIATGAFGRDASFDPQNDPIVRVEAVRLRRALEAYYAGDGRDDPVIIGMRSGSYVPSFEMNAARRRRPGRTQRLRDHLIGQVRDNLRLVILIAVIAALVSIGLDLFAGKFLSTGQLPAQETVRAVPSSAPVQDVSTGSTH